MDAVEIESLISQGMHAGNPGGNRRDDGFPVLVEDPPDNSDAFAAFHARGLQPIPENARPARMIASAQGGVHSHFAFGGSQAYAGWVWEDEAGNVRVLHGNTLSDRPVVLGHRHRPMGPGDADDEALVVIEADLLQDVRQYFQQTIRNREFTSRMTVNPEEVGQRMILAVRLHETGHTNLANQIAAHLFETAGKRESLMAALSVLHDYEYEHAFREYLASEDLGALIAATEGILEKSRGLWIKTEIARDLVEEWKQALAFETPEFETFSETQKGFYEAFANLDAMGGQRLSVFSSQNWLLAPQAKIEQYFRYLPESEASKEHPAEHLLALRVEAIPVLLALLEDARVLPMNNRQIGMMMGGHRSFRSSEDHQRFQMLQSFQRPAPIRNFAVNMLRGIHPNARNIRDDDELQMEMERLYEAFKGKSNLEIARHYFSEAPTFQLIPREALLTLVGARDEETLPLIREMILGDNNLLNHAEWVAGTPLSEGPAGEAFQAAYIENIQTRFAAEMEEEHSWEGRQAREALERFNVQREDFEALTLEQVVAAILADDDETMDRVEMLGRSATDFPDDFAEIQRIILPAILEADEEQEMELLEVLMELAFEDMGMGMGMYMGGHRSGFVTAELPYYMAADPDGPPGEETSDVAAETKKIELIPELWLPLLDRLEDPAMAKRVGHISGAIMFLSSKIEELEAFEQQTLWALMVDGPGDLEITRMIVPVAKKALANPESDWRADLPAASKVDEERSAEINAILEGDDPDAFREFLSAKNANEMLLYLELIQTPAIARNFDLWNPLADERRTLIDVGAKEIPEVIEAFLGKRLDLDDILSLLRFAQSEARAGNQGNIMLRETPHRLGLQLGYDADSSSRHGMGSVHLNGRGAASFHMQFSLEEEITFSGEAKPANENTDLMSMIGASWQKQGPEDLQKWLGAENLPFGIHSGGLYIFYSPKAE